MKIIIGRRYWLLALLALLATSAIVVWRVWPSSSPITDWSAEYDLTAHPPERIGAGKVIDRSIPPWYLVIKSLPRIRADQRNRVNALTARMSSWMFTAFVAEVAPNEHGKNRLRAIALGLGCSVNGQDTVVTPETVDQFGEAVEPIGKEILTKGYQVQDKAVVVIFGPTMGLVDTPVWYVWRGKHQLIRFRYALLIDGPNGHLDSVVWLVGPNGESPENPEAVWLKPGTVAPAELVVDESEIKFWIPSEAAFAVETLPPGQSRTFPPDLQGLSMQSRFTPNEAHTLEAELRKWLHTSRP